MLPMLYLRYPLLCILTCVLLGCASQSAKTIGSLDNESPEYASAACQNARHNAWIHEETPSAMLLLGPVALVPVFVTSVGVNTADHLKANDIAVNCGGKVKSQQEVNNTIALDATLSLAVGTVVPVASASK
ncbi:MAG: hypothetical protein NT095_08415 [Burkholderiales bacterium]|nr:hypothetical protein [Burkholderiales bacterium]